MVSKPGQIIEQSLESQTGLTLDGPISLDLIIGSRNMKLKQLNI